jgi:hypothetical protein
MLIAELFLLYNYQVSVKTGRVSHLDILLDSEFVSENVVQERDLLKFILIALLFTTLLIFTSIGYLFGKPPRDDDRTLRGEISSADSDSFFKGGDEFLHRKRKK